jgi:hypothetical protein
LCNLRANRAGAGILRGPYDHITQQTIAQRQLRHFLDRVAVRIEQTYYFRNFIIVHKNLTEWGEVGIWAFFLKIFLAPYAYSGRLILYIFRDGMLRKQDMDPEFFAVIIVRKKVTERLEQRYG